MTIVDGGGPYDERFEQIYRNYYGRVWRYFRANQIADDEAHDLTQDTFKRLYEYMEEIRNTDAGPFLTKVAKTILLNRVRTRLTKKRNVQLVGMDDPELVLPEPAAPQEPDYADREADRERRTRLRAAIGSLPPGQRECFRFWMGGHKYEEIATLLRISVDAVKSRLRDAKRTLRAQLGDKP